MDAWNVHDVHELQSGHRRLTAFEPINGVFGDLNSDGTLDLSDFALYLSGLHANLSGLTAEQAFMKGDLNGDLSNDFDDFVLFRQAYDDRHTEPAPSRARPVGARAHSWAMLTLGGVVTFVAHGARIGDLRAAPDNAPAPFGRELA